MMVWVKMLPSCMLIIPSPRPYLIPLTVFFKIVKSRLSLYYYIQIFQQTGQKEVEWEGVFDPFLETVHIF